MASKNDLEILKQQLESESSELEHEIKSEFSGLKHVAKKRMTQSLLVAGGSIAAISLLKLLLTDKKKAQKKARVKKGNTTPAISSRVKSAIITILLEVAKKKLITYLNEMIDDPESDNKPSTDK